MIIAQEDVKDLLVAAAWAEHEAARAAYRSEVERLRSIGYTKTGRASQLNAHRHRLNRAWVYLYELGEVDLGKRSRKGR